MILADKGSRLREAKCDFSCPNHLMKLLIFQRVL